MEVEDTLVMIEDEELINYILDHVSFQISKEEVFEIIDCHYDFLRIKGV